MWVNAAFEGVKGCGSFEFLCLVEMRCTISFTGCKISFMIKYKNGLSYKITKNMFFFPFHVWQTDDTIQIEIQFLPCFYSWKGEKNEKTKIK